jgi:hypothetical protein
MINFFQLGIYHPFFFLSLGWRKINYYNYDIYGRDKILQQVEIYALVFVEPFF